MTDNKEPDKKNKGAESTDEEEIIDLKEEAFDVSQDDDEIIELLEAVDESDVEDTKEGVVAQETESTEEEEIVDLVEQAFDAFQDDEEIIELTEATSDTPQEIEEIGEPIHVTTDASQEAEDITDLGGDLLEETVDFDSELDEDVALDQTMGDDFVDSLGMELDSTEDGAEDLLDAEKVSDEQVEAALERVIKKMFYDKIDHILVEVIEKSVTREIERIKGVLLEDAVDNKK